MSQNEPSTSPKKSVTNADGAVISTVMQNLKTLDANRYATKKTIAQGLLDVALLTANASQLKYVLQVGKQHEFYVLMLSLIIVSIVLQVVVGVLSLTGNLLRDCRLHQEEYHYSANWLNYFTTILSLAITFINLMISIFDPSTARFAIFEVPGQSIPLVVAILFVIIGGLNINKPRDHNAAIILNDTVQAFLCALLGTALNINKEKDQESANRANNFILFMNIMVVVINIIISSFHMSGTHTC